MEVKQAGKMQQPPPRKVKHTVALKNVHTEQLSKLHNKTQLDESLLEDVRSFSKQRSIIEREYAQALTKCAQQYLAKHKYPPPPDIASDDGQEHKTVQVVWKSILELTDHLGKARLQAADTLLQQVSEPCKPIINAKKQISKKVSEQAATLQKEVSQSVHEMVKSHKVYNEDEHISHEARTKAEEAEGKLKNKSTGIFTSLATLQKNSAKLQARRETCEIKSTSSRNEYLLNLAAANAHQIRYYSTDLPELMKLLDCDMNDKLRDFFINLSMAELECCGLTQECFTKVMSDSALISQGYNMQCFLHENHVFTNLLQYKFEPQDSDKVTTVSPEHSAKEHLEKEARKWASKVAKENKSIKENTRQLNILQTQGATERKPSESSQEGPQSPVDPEVKIEEMKQNIRKAETGKLKAEARIEALRLGGINVDQYMNQANAEMLAVEEEEASHRSSSSMSVKTESSGGAKSRNESAIDDSDSVTNNSNSLPNDSTYINYEEEDDFIDETFDAEHTASQLDNTSSTGYSSGRNYPLKCHAVYDFQGSNADELTIKEGEELQLVADGDGDGWVKARNSIGQVGFVPENYIQISDDQTNGFGSHNGVNVDDPPSSAGYTDYGSAPPSAGYSTDISSSAPPSAGYSTDYGSAPPSAGYGTDYGSAPSSATNHVTVTTEEVENLHQEHMIVAQEGPWVRALYDYDATSEEELSFVEGQLIRILHKNENGIDDGWWKGEVDGRVGVFPSLVVEELDETTTANGDVLLSPVGMGPPAFTPPEPGPPPPHLEITHPTPTEDPVSTKSGVFFSQHLYEYPYWQRQRSHQESTV